jgi:UDP-2-acetamido-3-amino-2,3-dideoxy-glucuronate N-acetyltransferase
MVHPTASIHPTAIVEADATVGAGTHVWHFCHVRSGARVGARCVLGQGVYVGGRAVIGDGCRIQNNVSIYDGVELAEEVFVGPSAVFTNVSRPRAFVSRRQAFQPTRVARGATIGANATIVCGRAVGAFAFVGAGAVVTKDVAAHALMVGVPARRIGWVCRCGATLPAASNADENAGGPGTTRVLCVECGAEFLVGAHRADAASDAADGR